MMDREQTIKEMTVLRNWLLHMAEFNSHGNGDMYDHDGYTVASALELLKKQEPKQVIGIADSIEGMEVGYCPSCDRAIVNKKIDETKFCKFCGQAVKWDA